MEKTTTSLPETNIGRTNDEYAFIMVGCHGGISVKCHINPDKSKNLDLVIPSNKNMILTQFIESPAGCIGFISHEIVENMFYYLANNTSKFYEMLKNNPSSINPVKTYKYFIKTAYDLQKIIRRRLFNTPISLETHSHLFQYIDEHNESIDYANMQYISKNFIEKIYVVNEETELPENRGIFLFTKDYPLGINIFDYPQLLERIIEFEKDLDEIKYNKLRKSYNKNKHLMVSLFAIMRYLESIGITQTYLHDTSCSVFQTIKQNNISGSCELSPEEESALKRIIREQIILNERQRQEMNRYRRERGEEVFEFINETTYPSLGSTLRRYPSLGSSGINPFERKLQATKRIEEYLIPEEDILIDDAKSNIITNPLQKYGSQELELRYNPSTYDKKRKFEQPESDTDIDEQFGTPPEEDEIFEFRTPPEDVEMPPTKKTRKNKNSKSINKQLIKIPNKKSKKTRNSKRGGNTHKKRKSTFKK
jgi:hypothetical protein